MTKERAGRTGRDTFTEDQVIEEVTVLPDVADAVRREGLAQAVVLGRVQTRAAEREQVRRRLKYGAASPQAAAAERRVTLQRGFATETGAESQRAWVERPQGAEDRFILHGRVTDRSGLGLPGLTVAMTAPDRTVLEYACTDRRGYFRLVLMAGGRGKAAGDAATLEAREALLKRQAHAQLRDADRREAAGLQVSDGERRVLHRDPRPVIPRRGGVEYREIRLGDDDGCPDCEPPPGPNDPPPPDRPPPDRPPPDRPPPDRPPPDRPPKDPPAKGPPDRERPAPPDNRSEEERAREQEARDRVAKEQAAREREERERAAREQAEKDRAAQERAERERAEKERARREAEKPGAPVKDPPAREPPVKEPPAKEPPAKEPPVRDPPVRDPPVRDPGPSVVVPGRSKLTDVVAGRLSGQVVGDIASSRLKGSLAAKLTRPPTTKKTK